MFVLPNITTYLVLTAGNKLEAGEISVATRVLYGFTIPNYESYYPIVSPVICLMDVIFAPFSPGFNIRSRLISASHES
jgi:hypothetical protein